MVRLHIGKDSGNINNILYRDVFKGNVKLRQVRNFTSPLQIALTLFVEIHIPADRKKPLKDYKKDRLERR